MYTDVLRSIAGVGVFPVISLLLFVAVFGSVLVWAWRVAPATLDEIAALPLAAHAATEADDERSGGVL